VGATVQAVSVDPVDVNREVAEEHGLEFTILSDPDLRAIDAFGLRHAGGSMYGGDIARPATYVVRDGVVLWRALTDNWRVRLRADDLVRQVARLRD